MNILILGSGRSGTSMVAGCLAKSGYFMGDNLYPARFSNPKGFYEDPEINGINEELLSQLCMKRPPIIGSLFYRDRLPEGTRWLARIELGNSPTVSPELAKRIRSVTSREPYCFKDPRFSYTLSAWRPFLRDTAFLCVFRDPSQTANSILKECRSVKKLKHISIDYDEALRLWTLMYKWILATHSEDETWLFLHYEQVLNRDGIARIEERTGARVDFSFPDTKLKRSARAQEPVPAETKAIYDKLCDLAEFRP